MYSIEVIERAIVIAVVEVVFAALKRAKALVGELTRLFPHRVCEGLTDPANC